MLKKLVIIARVVDTISILALIIGFLLIVVGVSTPIHEPELTFQQYQELSAVVIDAELAAVDGIGGRHALVVVLLNRWGFIVSGASWQIIRFAQRLLDKGWKPGTEPKAEDW